MKKYPKALADVSVLKEVLDYLYRQAEEAENQADYYEKAIKESEEENGWYIDCLAEHKAKAEAYVRLAERMAK